MSKHTPGEWRFEAVSGEIRAKAVPGPRICVLADWLPEFADEREANARLIAAAPRLLAALKTIRESAICRHEIEAHFGEEIWDAITEAEGA